MLGGFAIAIPALLRRPETKEVGVLGYIPSTGSSHSVLSSLSSAAGSMLFILFSAAVAALEMMIRDQVWFL